MSMQPKNLKKLNRLLYLLNILDSGEIQVPREARELDVTERTIQRDINDIGAGGFPIYKAAPGVYKFIIPLYVRRTVRKHYQVD